ncbi:MAG TPA: antibiotic biosynthesis monooxygenase family protein, partial [Solirubrobacteraceae bacterium]
PEADDAFLADWASQRGGSAVLYRALRADVDFRFVAVAPVDDGSPAPGHYEVVREEGAPDGSEGVTLINPFEVPEGEDERFVAGWERARAALADQRGYLGTRLHRALGESDLRFVNLARWSSPLMFARATQRPEFRAAATALRFPAHPALYSVVREVERRSSPLRRG